MPRSTSLASNHLESWTSTTLEADTAVEVLIELDEVSIDLDEDDVPTWEVTRKQQLVPRSPLSKDPTAEQVPRLLRATCRWDREVTRKRTSAARRILHRSHLR